MKKMVLGCLAVFVAVVILFVVIAGIVTWTSYNGFVNTSQAVDSQWAQVENVYQRRADLVPNLVSTVRGAANFEKTTMIAVTKARASVGQMKIDASKAPQTATQLQKFEQAQGQLSHALSRLMVVSERYPDLKANKNFLALQAQLEGTENRIAVERRRFNQVAQTYNTKIKRFPGMIFARMFNFQPKPYFKSTAGAEKPPTVNFDFNDNSASKTTPATPAK